MALYGYPTITLKDKDTGKIKKEISCKNIQTIPARMMFSGRYYSSDGYAEYNIGNYAGIVGQEPSICTLPYRMPKTPYFAIDTTHNETGYYISNKQRAFSYGNPNGIVNNEFKNDVKDRTILVYREIFHPPVSGTREIGTICLQLRRGNSGPIHFYTSLDEIIKQDPATTIDISYKIIIHGNNPREYAYNYCGFLGGVSMDKGFNVLANRPTETAELKKEISPIAPGEQGLEYGVDSLCSGVYSGMNDTLYNSIRPESGRFPYSVSHYVCGSSIGSASYMVNIERGDIGRCGIFIGSLGIDTNLSLSPNDISRVSNGKGVGNTFSKTRSDTYSVKPFFESTLTKNGSGSVKAISATEKRGLPERWEIDVVKSGTLSTAEFRIRKTIVSGYEGNSNVAIPMLVDHLSYEGSIGNFRYTKYNHPDGRLYESSPAVWPLYGENIAIVIRKGVLLTSVGNARYVILDETNLPHENRGIQITGIAWDDSKKGLLIGCGESGLYRVDFDNDTDNEPIIRRVTKDGIEHVYAISGNGKGYVAIVTDAGIMYSDNLGDTWSTKTFDTIKSQISSVDEYDDSHDYVQMFKHKIFCFLISRDGSSIIVTDKYQEDRSECLNIKLGSSEAATSEHQDGTAYFKSSVIMGPNAEDRFDFAPICFSHEAAEEEKMTIKELVSSDKYAIQPNACIGIGQSDNVPDILPKEFVNIANGSIVDTLSTNTPTEIFGHEYQDRFRMSDGAIISRRDNRKGSIVHNGRWGVWLDYTGDSKTRVYIVGAALSHTQDSPALFEYYDYASNTFKRGEAGLKYTPTSEDVTIDGVNLKFSGDTFEAGDCFIFHRTTSYVDDNISTMKALMEKSVLKKSEWIEKTGTISKEAPKPTYRHPICVATNMYKTRDNRLKTKDRTFTSLGAIGGQSPQYRTAGGAKFKFDLSKFKGGFLIHILSADDKDYLAKGYTYREIYVVNDEDGIKCLCRKSRSTYKKNDYENINFGITGDSVYLDTTSLFVTIDHERRMVVLNNGHEDIATLDLSEYNDSPMYDIRIVPLGMYKGGGVMRIYDHSRIDYGDAIWINDEADIPLPTFEYGYRGAICTQLGDEATAVGAYDPIFYGTPSIISDDSMVIEIDGKLATVHYKNTSYDNPKNHDSIDRIGEESLLKDVESRNTISADTTSGKVVIDTYMGIVYFSDEDIGKSYRIRYKYYKGESLGIGEEIVE